MAKITDVPGIGASAAEALASHGITTVVELANSPVGRIAGVRGFGPTRAAAVKQAATAILLESGSKSKTDRKTTAKPSGEKAKPADKDKGKGKKKKKKKKKKNDKKKDKKKDKKRKKDKKKKMKGKKKKK
ncbi:MAG: helix-hairpin-helix domain-containing protein [Acidobacteria bacterium]|nr:MAG: helix-hairpin-helix domain-containing protein [Acidobacteriota bacterium]